MHINYLAVVIASALQFIFSGIWYTPVFGKTWGKIHGFDQKSPEERKAMMKSVGPMLATQFVITVIATSVFALLLNGFLGNWNLYGLAGFFWLGFVLPTQIGAVIFSRTEDKWKLAQIAIMGGASLANLEIAAAVLKMMP